MRHTKYEVNKYEVHECKLDKGVSPCIVISDKFEYSDTMDKFMVIPLKDAELINSIEEAENFIELTGTPFVPVKLGKIYLADIGSMTSVNVSNMIGYYFNIDEGSINKLNEAIAKFLTFVDTNSVRENMHCSVIKYDVWEIDNGRDVIILNHKFLQDGKLIVCYVDDEYDDLCIEYMHDRKLYAHVYTMFNIETYTLTRRKYSISDPEIIRRIDGAIMNVFFGNPLNTISAIMQTADESENNVDANEVVTENDEVAKSEVAAEDVDTDVFEYAVEEIQEKHTESEIQDTNEVVTENDKAVESDSEIIDFSAIGSDGDDTSDVEPESVEDLAPQKSDKRKGSSHSRKRLEKPENFSEYYNDLKKGKKKKHQICRELGVSDPVVNRWIKEHEAEVKKSNEFEY